MQGAASFRQTRSPREKDEFQLFMDTQCIQKLAFIQGKRGNKGFTLMKMYSMATPKTAARPCSQGAVLQAQHYSAWCQTLHRGLKINSSYRP
jgi:hypothetical protein